jgi:hypothetical protein
MSWLYLYNLHLIYFANFQASVRPTIWATYKGEEIWKERPAKHLAWRYIGTKAGFIRFYPESKCRKKGYVHQYKFLKKFIPETRRVD